MGSIADIMNVRQEADDLSQTSYYASTPSLLIFFDKLIISIFQSDLIVGPLYTELYRFPPKTTQNIWKIVRIFTVDTTRRKTKQDVYWKRGFTRSPNNGTT